MTTVEERLSAVEVRLAAIEDNRYPQSEIVTSAVRKSAEYWMDQHAKRVRERDLAREALAHLRESLANLRSLL